MSKVTIDTNRLDGYGIQVYELLEAILQHNEEQIILVSSSISSIAKDHKKQKIEALHKKPAPV